MKTVLVVAACVCLFAAWIWAEHRHAVALRPPQGATNLAAFLQARPESGPISRFVHAGNAHIKVVGRPGGTGLSLPSGPPVYIFDTSGRLVDWCGDLGDNEEFLRKWGGFSNATALAADEAIRSGSNGARQR